MAIRGVEERYLDRNAVRAGLVTDPTTYPWSSCAAYALETPNRVITLHPSGEPAAWVDDVETRGLEEARKVPGYHDEPLHGARQGQRSIRLSRSYRAIYLLKGQAASEFVSIEEVSKHVY